MIALSFSSVLLRSAVIQVMALKALTFLLKMFLEVSKFRSYVKGQWISWGPDSHKRAENKSWQSVKVMLFWGKSWTSSVFELCQVKYIVFQLKNWSHLQVDNFRVQFVRSISSTPRSTDTFKMSTGMREKAILLPLTSTLVTEATTMTTSKSLILMPPQKIPTILSLSGFEARIFLARWKQQF